MQLRNESSLGSALAEARKPLESFDRKEDCSTELDADATAIMLRRLPTKFTAESLIQVLDEFLPPGRYNFVYVPHDKRKLRNLALAFVNFTDPESAKTAYVFFRDVKHPLLGQTIRVCQADIQGLGSNLAYFMARFGLQEMENPHAPLVFEKGIRQTNMLEAVKHHVTFDLLLQAHHRMETQAMKAPSPTSPQQDRDRMCPAPAGRSKTILSYQPEPSSMGVSQYVPDIPTPSFCKLKNSHVGGLGQRGFNGMAPGAHVATAVFGVWNGSMCKYVFDGREREWSRRETGAHLSSRMETCGWSLIFRSKAVGDVSSIIQCRTKRVIQVVRTGEELRRLPKDVELRGSAHPIPL
eukprot:s1959_g5.t1